MDPPIVTRDLTKRFRRGRRPWRREKILAVDGVSLEVPSGSISGLVGPNGAGFRAWLKDIAFREQRAEKAYDEQIERQMIAEDREKRREEPTVTTRKTAYALALAFVTLLAASGLLVLRRVQRRG